MHTNIALCKEWNYAAAAKEISEDRRKVWSQILPWRIQKNHRPPILDLRLLAYGNVSKFLFLATQFVVFVIVNIVN